MLRFVPNGAVVGIDCGRPTSRGLPPAALWGMGAAGKRLPLPKMGFSRVWTLERVRAEPAGLPAGWFGNEAATGRAECWELAGEGSRCWAHAPDVRREKRWR